MTTHLNTNLWTISFLFLPFLTGAILTENSLDLQNAFKYAIHLHNLNSSSKFKAEPVIDVVDSDDPFKVTTACKYWVQFCFSLLACLYLFFEVKKIYKIEPPKFYVPMTLHTESVSEWVRVRKSSKVQSHSHVNAFGSVSLFEWIEHCKSNWSNWTISPQAGTLNFTLEQLKINLKWKNGSLLTIQSWVKR